MEFEKNTVYHVFNQGNNREQVFYTRDNYLFFVQKMRAYLLPYAELLCYCLMPNHFHWLIQVVETELAIDERDLSVKRDGAPPLRTDCNGDLTGDWKKPRFRSLNDSIGILLRSYTRALNKQEGRSGSLFRAHTQAKDGWIDEFITVDRYRNGPFDFRAFPDDEYGYNCFNYIHDNPCEASLCVLQTDWEYSSARDFAGLRNGTLCNQALARELLRLP